ncbi:unnamed protein product [Caenorhabditis angaria]|uniref:Peptidase M13 C-terminal domain-containing protein n=1 Tax=Caenorhabditis angaria TaxID=860376 RepID=A0A9P1NA99_9PELO|nr:unnamed protein product [Caenorhabditis angaria]
MLNFKILLTFIVFAGISCDYVIDYAFRNMLNSSVDRCDNFYRHVCKVGTKHGMLKLGYSILEEDYGNFTVTDDISEYLVELMKCSETDYKEGTVTEKLRNLLENAIQNGEEDIFLNNMKNIRNFTGHQNQFSQFLANWESDLIARYQLGCELVIGYNKERLWLYKNTRVIDDFEKILNELKPIFNTWIEETPSFKKYQVVDKYHDIVSNLELQNMSSSHRISQLTTEFKNCQKMLGQWLNDQILVNIICIDDNYQRYRNNSERLLTNFNAFLDGNFVNLGLPFYAVASRIETESFYTGLLGFGIAHEMSHSVIQSNGDEKKLFFSQRTTNCIQNQYYKSCDYYNVPSDNCIQYLTRIDDNGSDLLGFRGVIQLAKNQFGRKLYEQNDEYSDYTNLQLLFMGQASFACNYRISDKDHSPFVIRSNAIAAQNPEFRDAFKCGPNSNISKSLHKTCYILGPNASPE